MKKLGEGWMNQHKFAKSFWTGEFEKSKVNYIVLDDSDSAGRRIKYFFSEKIKEDIVIMKVIHKKTCDLKLEYNIKNEEMKINIITKLGDLYLYDIVRELFSYRRRFILVKAEGVKWAFAYNVENSVDRIDMYASNGKAIGIYLFKGENIIHLDDIDKNKEIAVKSSEIYMEIQRKQYLTLKNKFKNQYDVDDLLSLGGLKIESDDGSYARLLFAGEFGKGNFRLLKIPFDSDLIIAEKGYDLAGSIVWKCIVLVPHYPFVHQVFLIGKEYTGFWWMHSLPPTYWNKSIAECEKWLLDLKDGDIVVNES